MHHVLTNWEIGNLGKQTFSQAFELVIDNIMTSKGKATKNVHSKPTVADSSRQLKSTLNRRSNSKTSLGISLRKASHAQPGQQKQSK